MKTVSTWFIKTYGRFSRKDRERQQKFSLCESFLCSAVLFDSSKCGSKLDDLIQLFIRLNGGFVGFSICVGMIGEKRVKLPPIPKTDLNVIET